MILTLFFKGCIDLNNLTRIKNKLNNVFISILDHAKAIKTVS